MALSRLLGSGLQNYLLLLSTLALCNPRHIILCSSKKQRTQVVTMLCYVDDLLIAGNNSQLISEVKSFLASQFHIKDLGPLIYILGIEVNRSSHGFFLSQRKYVMDLIKEYNRSGGKPLKLHVDPHMKLTHDMGPYLSQPTD